MRLVPTWFTGAACIAALAACAGCKREHVDRDGFAQRNFDYGTGVTDKSGAPSSGDRVGTTTVTGADYGALSNELAVERIVAARCARETACNNVGSDKHFVNHDVCARELRSKIGDDLKPSECPRGIDPEAVDKCMEAIRTESCNNPVDTVQRLATCRTSEMCLKGDIKTR
ncbi:MAG: hypothetical protein JWP87_4446 [Labilithrix sp.]|nr:hypothetical protein [Labilithrix sp.]